MLTGPPVGSPRPVRRGPTRRSSRLGFGRLLAVGLAALAATTGLAACKPAPPPPPPKRTVQACDTSVCLIAWQVVDSDGDGVCDADELMAGTDPFDPRSRPGLTVLVELTLDRKLPSFEYGRSFMVVVPIDVQMRREAERDPLSNPAIPATRERTSVLDGLGFDLEALTGHGIDAGRDGFTLGLEPKKKGEELPGRRIGGIPMEQVAADDAGGGGRIDDCCIPLVMDHGEVVQHIDYGDWQATTWADGAQTICSNDAGCRTDPPPKGDDGYSNPDADPGSSPSGELTEEQKKAFERIYGAAERRVEGWNPPSGDPADIEDPWSTVSLFDPNADPNGGTGPGRVMIFDVPRVTTAQPEVRPDLPSPLDRAPGAPPCTAGCA